ncbi:hypothetical protein PENSPDRAFT_594981 [Peniophora sp. CONT]|nr:hypothetical protein PENSPDRAFT_594981 [Peniophora sp. CONT]
MRARILRQTHESASFTAHAGPEKLHPALASRIYWSRMGFDTTRLCASCDVCQETKDRNFTEFGLL